MTAILKQPRKTLPGVITESRWLPPKLCIHGVPGIGKSTFAADAPNPIFLPTEDGIENIEVARFPVAKALDEFLANLNLVATGDHDYESVVIDTLNGIMSLYYQAKKNIPGDKGKPLYDFIGFGGHGGWGGVGNDIRNDVLPLLDLCKRRNMYVILLAHTGNYTRKNPLGEDIVVAAPSIHKNVWHEIHPWLDVIGRADYVYTTTSIGKKAKASTDETVINGVRVKTRRLTFAGGVEQDCKTRVGYELPPEMPLSWEAYEDALGNVNALAKEVWSLWQYMPKDKEATTLAWLGAQGNGLSRLAELADAGRHNRSKLSQLRNRLLEMKALAEAAAGETEPPAKEPAA